MKWRLATMPGACRSATGVRMRASSRRRRAGIGALVLLGLGGCLKRTQESVELEANGTVRSSLVATLDVVALLRMQAALQEAASGGLGGVPTAAEPTDAELGKRSVTHV